MNTPKTYLLRNRSALYIYTPSKFGHTRTLRFLHERESGDRGGTVKSLAVIRRADYELFRKCGGFYSGGIYTRTVWI